MTFGCYEWADFTRLLHQELLSDVAVRVQVVVLVTKLAHDRAVIGQLIEKQLCARISDFAPYLPRASA